jgi:hypothetical protein
LKLLKRAYTPGEMAAENKVEPLLETKNFLRAEKILCPFKTEINPNLS